MNKTCFESGDHAGITQQPPVVSWRASGVGVGVIVGVGRGVTVGCAVGKTTVIVGVAEDSSGVTTGTGVLAAHAARNNTPITPHATRIRLFCILFLDSAFII
jgi:hypothetical protein